MQNMNDLIPWILRELQERGWSQAELARRSGISAAGVSQILSEQRLPTPDFCIAIARALRIPPEDVLRRAGILPAVPNDDALAAAAGLTQETNERVDSDKP